MASTIEEGFDVFNRWLVPSDNERAKAASHRQTIHDKLDATYGLHRMFQSGSFKHGTGISQHSDVDYFVSLKTARPQDSSSILSSVRETLANRFPSTYVHVSRPAVVLEFGQGYERVEIIPAYFNDTAGDNEEYRYIIPGVVSDDNWIWSTPEEHLNYVNASDIGSVKAGSTKRLTRLMKAWKYYWNVPISSFYLEMRTAQYMRGEKAYVPQIDLRDLLKSLASNELASMNDPTGNTGRINACSSDTTKKEALSKLDSAVTRADSAMYYVNNNRIDLAFNEWNMLFNHKFPVYNG